MRKIFAITILAVALMGCTPAATVAPTPSITPIPKVTPGNRNYPSATASSRPTSIPSQTAKPTATSKESPKPSRPPATPTARTFPTPSPRVNSKPIRVDIETSGASGTITISSDREPDAKASRPFDQDKTITANGTMEPGETLTVTVESKNFINNSKTATIGCKIFDNGPEIRKTGDAILLTKKSDTGLGKITCEWKYKK